MAEKSNDKSMLDRLRKQSETIKANETPTRPVEEILVDMDRRLWRAYRTLDEMLAHLEVIRPVVAHEFRFETTLQMSGLQFERDFVSYRRRHLAGQELLDYVELFYRLVGAAPIQFKVQPNAVGAFEERLRVSSIPFQYRAETGENRSILAGHFTVTPTITSSIRFDPDYRRQRIGVRLTNVDRFESVELEFKPEQFDEAAVDDLVRFMLGESNVFLRRAPLAGVGANRRGAPLEEAPVYRIEKTARHR